MTVTCLAVVGVDPAAQLAMDQGSKRTPGDQLRLLQVPHAPLVGGIVSIAIRWARGAPTGNGPVTTAEIVSVNDHWADRLQVACNSVTPCRIATPSILGFLAFIVGPAAGDFIDAVSAGANLSAGNPALKYRDIAIRQKGLVNGSQKKNTKPMMLALTIKAWNAWHLGNDVPFLRWVRFGRSQEDFPTIEAAELTPAEIVAVVENLSEAVMT